LGLKQPSAQHPTNSTALKVCYQWIWRKQKHTAFNWRESALYISDKNTRRYSCKCERRTTVAIWQQLWGILCQPSFVIFDIRALWRSALSIRVPRCQKYKWWLNPVWHRML